MSLTWKDAAATLLVGVMGVVTYARVKGFDWPLLGSWRMGSLVLLVIGLGTCTLVGTGVTPTKNLWTTAATVLGVAALVAALVGIIANNQLAFYLLAGDVGVLWVLTTMHHILGRG